MNEGEYPQSMKDTEIKLKLWRGDQIGAERLAATILHLEGFSSVDPQCPLGGPDGLKDVLCQKNEWNYVAAVYFPTSDKPFSHVKKKFGGDLKGVASNGVDGIVFLTNQTLTPSERDTLALTASKKGHKSIIYHLERIRALLDSPSGYGARLQFLDIDMSREEQLSFFSQWNRSFADQLQVQSLMIIREIGKKIDALAGTSNSLDAQIHKLDLAISQTQSLLIAAAAPSDKKNITSITSEFATKELTVEAVCMLHRALLFDAPSGTQIGVLRAAKLWIGEVGSSFATATFVPPDPDEVPDLLEKLLSDWRASFTGLEAAGESEKISAITRFHHKFVSIHPFTDGNGRLARFLLSQQARELLNQRRRVVIDDRRPYFDALSKADKGDYSALEAEIAQAIMGGEFILGSPCEMAGQVCPTCGEGVMQMTSDGVDCPTCGTFMPAGRA